MKSLASVFFFLIICLSSLAQEGIPYISYYDDNVDIEVQNWAICQDPLNVMLFANPHGLLTYDGHQWNLIHLEHIPTALSRCPVDNRIYAGANNNYGILEKNRAGRYEYLPISGDTANTGLITRIIFTDTTVIYYSDKSINVHKLDDLSDYKRWYAEEESPFTGMIAHRGKLFFNVEGKGLYRIESDTLFPIVTGYLTEEREIIFTLPYDDKRKLVGTDDNKLQLFDRIKYYDFEINKPEYLQENILTDAVIIADSLIALSTLYGGVMVINKETGDEVALLNYQNGLPDDEIYAINTDNNNGLWMTHGYGICRVDFKLPVSSYSHYPGLQGVITAIFFHNDRLYAGTNEGLFYLDQVREYDKKEVLYRKPPSVKEKEEPPGEEGELEKAGPLKEKPVIRFFNRLFGREEEAQEEKKEEEKEVTQVKPSEPQYGKRTISVLKSINYVNRKIEQIDYRIKQLIPAGSGIIVLSTSGLHYVENSSARLISADRTINSVSKLDNNNCLVCSNNGLFLLKCVNGEWRTGQAVEDITGPVYNAAIIDPSSCWLGSMDKILKVEGSWTEQELDIEEYNFPGDYPVSYEVALSGDDIFAFAEKTVYKYLPLTDSFDLYTDAEKNIKEGESYKYLISAEHYPMVKTGEGWKCLNTKLEGIERIEGILRLFNDLNYISIEDKDLVWLADDKNNIYRIEGYSSRKLDTEFSMYISGVKDSENNFYELENMVFEPDERKISVSITAPYYLKKTSTRYQHLIEGYMETWSDWTTNPEINIFLEPGDYRIHFRAMNILGEMSREKTISFSIKPPFTKSAFFYVIAGVVVAGLFVLIVIFREKKLKHDKRVLEEKVKQRTLEIEQKKEQIEQQRDEIMHQKEEITSSIAYASRIQTAMLSGRKLFKNNFKDHFILFKPRDIVSGDFYWIAGNKDRVYFTTADCTGHGVPGAFMSMLGISLLNEITSDGEKDLKPSEILELLRNKVIMSLSHTKTESRAVDGMDLAFCKYNRKKKILEYAGAFNPLYHFRNGELTEYKADRMPVGSYIPHARNFTNNEIPIQAGDVIYIFSDGYSDQFGGPENKKFSTRQFKSSLAEVVNMPMKKQHEILEKRIMKWKEKVNQLDDVILIGIRF
ncbi:MAG: SpoIIE family protein phosphatase [Bacteroidota bacterium]|nr:SpoIIE family protein phosphatase [Bacteroidota bacterium]